VDTNTNAAPPAAALSPARLLIHSVDLDGVRERHFDSPLQRLRALRVHGPWHDKRALLCLQIDDLHGQRVHSVEGAGPLMVLPLPAGTYHISVHFGDVRRRYTLTLEPGASFDLYPRLAPDR